MNITGNSKKYFSEVKDISKRKEILQLFEEWLKVISGCKDILFSDDGKYYPATDYFVKDGFYPGYFSGKYPRVLFIGRENRYISSYSKDNDRILHDLEYSFENNPDKDIFWRRVFYMFYAVITGGKFPYSKVPYPSEMIADKLYGFALMNISKYSNDCDDGANADYSLINRFLDDTNLSKRNFIREEIRILDPDVIITANLWESKIKKEYLELVFPDKDFKLVKSYKNVANLYDFKFENKKIKLIDTYHFSAIGSDASLFYDPVSNLIV